MKLIPETTIDLEKWYEKPAEAAYVRPPSEFTEQVIARLRDEGEGWIGTPLPWLGVAGMWAVRPGELTIYAGIGGHGKSLLTGQIGLSLASVGEPVCFVSLEMPPERTLYRLTRQGAGPHIPTEDRVRHLHAMTDERIWLFDYMGTLLYWKVIGLIRYVGTSLSVKHVVVDSLMKLGIGSDDYNEQKNCISQLQDIAQETGVHIHLVHHARKGAKETDVLDKFSVRGAGEIMDLADNGIIVTRNKKKEINESRPEHEQDPEIKKQKDVVINVCKQRDHDWEGTFGLYYHHMSMQLTEEAHAIDYLSRFENLEGL